MIRLLLCAVAVVGCTPAPVAPPVVSVPSSVSAAPAPVVAPVPEVTVTKNVDGDTVHVSTPSGPEVIRIIGVDTPEVFGGKECYGPEASAFARDTLPVGARVTLVRDPSQAERDRYRRLLRYIEVGGRDYSEAAIRAGMGTYVEYGKPVERKAALVAAEAEARAAGRGLWSACPVGG
jgi:micrococcal nuclease